ncbi:MAG TPA: transposase [Planctomycetaceae bacterium]|nr:transposase [Planctomycetaceae bacterium]
MRSRKIHSISSRQVQALAQTWLAESLLLEDHGWKATADVVWKVVLLAAARMCSLFAACRDLALAPCDETVRQALFDNLPKRPVTLERWLEAALCGHLPKWLFSRSRKIAIDLHLIPYHGEPKERANELYHSQPKSGTTKFHAYATACVVEAGCRYTLAATYVRGKEPMVAVLKRLLERIAVSKIAIRMLLLDRGFFASHVMEFLQKQKSPFVIPIVLRGRKSKKRASKKKGQTKKQRRAAGLRAFRNKPVGRYAFTWDVKNVSVTFHVVVAYKSYKHHKTGRRHSKRLLYAVWNVGGAPLEIREPYRKRFGIEASYRQLGQARIRTCTDDPVLRLFFVLVALVLRNVWVWLHFTYFAERGGPERTMHLERLRFRRMLNWIAQVVATELHDGSDYFSQIE